MKKNISLFVVLLVLLSLVYWLVLNNSQSWNTEKDLNKLWEPITDFSKVHTCDVYLNFMDCVLEKTEDEEIISILTSSLETTKETRLRVNQTEESLTQACSTTLQSLSSQLYLFDTWCQIVTDDAKITDYFVRLAINSGNAPEEVIEEEVVEEAVVEEVIEEEVIEEEVIEEEVIEEVIEEQKTIIEQDIEDQPVWIKRIRVLQNQVWFLRVRAWATLGSAELWRLSIGEEAEIVTAINGRVKIKYWGSEWWVSSKYVTVFE